MIHKVNGKSIAIPDKELDNIVENLECSLIEAIEVWLDDNGYTENAEQSALDTKAKKEVKVSNLISAQKPKQKTQRERVTKPDEVKEMIIKVLADALKKTEAAVQVTDKRKAITFQLRDDEFKINLTRTRKPKN